MKYVTVNASSIEGNDKESLLRQAENVAKYCARKVANAQGLNQGMVYSALCSLVMAACATNDEKIIRRCIRIARTPGFM